MSDFAVATALVPGSAQIQRELRNYVLSTVPVNQPRWQGFRALGNQHLLKNCPQTASLFRDLGLRLHHVAISNLAPGQQQNIHSDWIPQGTSDYALLFEIQNCCADRTRVFRVKPGREHLGIPQPTSQNNDENSPYLHWRIEDLDLVSDYDLREPRLVRISMPHQAQNHSSLARTAITFRFYDDPRGCLVRSDPAL